MAIDVSPVVTALTDVGVAVAGVGIGVLLLLVTAKCYQYISGVLQSRRFYKGGFKDGWD